MFISKIIIYRIINEIIFSSFRIFYEESIVKEHKNKINNFLWCYYIDNTKLMKNQYYLEKNKLVLFHNNFNL